MAEQQALEATSPLAESFPLFGSNDYDFAFQYDAWPIGLQSTFPEELIRRIAAAMLSCQFGYAGIDYAYKTYTKDEKYPVGDGSRLDWRIDRAVKYQSSCLSELILQVTPHDGKGHGEIISEWCFLRIPHSIKLLLSCGHRGALFECSSIARMILEQMAWACRIDSLNDLAAIKVTSATKAIGTLNGLCPVGGRLYGWLSSHTHWVYEAHIKAFEHDKDKDQLVAVFASSQFKATSLCLAALMSIVATKTFVALKPNNVAQVLSSSDDKLLRETDNTNPFRFSREPSIADVTTAITCADLLTLVLETARIAPSKDIQALARMASELTSS